jgi:aquaporin Z
MKTWQKYAAEFYGTFVLVGVGCGAAIASVFMTGQMVGGNLFVNGVALEAGAEAAVGLIPGVAAAGSFESKIVTIALAFGIGLMVALYTVGRISGGHFNPAVSLAMFLDRRMGLKDMVGYWVAQIAGAFLAMIAYWWILGDRSDVAVSANAPNRAAVNELGAFVGEVILTLVFVFAVLVLSKSEAATKFLAIGFSLTAVHLVGIAFTGTSVNPARSIAPSVIGDTYDGFWIFMAGPLLGAVLAWVLYKVIIEGDTDLTDDVKAVADAV